MRLSPSPPLAKIGLPGKRGVRYSCPNSSAAIITTKMGAARSHKIRLRGGGVRLGGMKQAYLSSWNSSGCPPGYEILSSITVKPDDGLCG